MFELIKFWPITYLSIACRSLAGFHVGSNRTTTLAPTKLRPRPPALIEQRASYQRSQGPELFQKKKLLKKNKTKKKLV